jgi:hypothetical protein
MHYKDGFIALLCEHKRKRLDEDARDFRAPDRDARMRPMDAAKPIQCDGFITLAINPFLWSSIPSASTASSSGKSEFSQKTER